MNVLSDTWRGLVQRRLWPVALLLLAAAAAVPFLLASDADPVPAANVPVAPATEAGDAPKPIVAVASAAQRETGRDVVGARKDPFRPAVKARKGKGGTTTTSSSGGSAQPAGDAGSGSDSGSAGGGGSAPTAPATDTPPTGGGGIQVQPRKRYEIATIAVRFGESSGERPVRDLRRLKALPSVVSPVAIYLGLTDDSKRAVFMIDAGTVVQGDGKCLPSPQNCQTVELREGETVFLDVAGDSGVTQYQLDFEKVRRKKVASAAVARRHRLAEAAGGRMILRERSNRMGRWRYDEKKGTIRQLGLKAYKAAVARAASRGED